MLQIEDFKKKITKNSRLIGLDLGKKRIGVAICDDKRIIATPYKTIIKENFDQFLSELLIIINMKNNYESDCTHSPEFSEMLGTSIL